MTVRAARPVCAGGGAKWRAQTSPCGRKTPRRRLDGDGAGAPFPRCLSAGRPPRKLLSNKRLRHRRRRAHHGWRACRAHKRLLAFLRPSRGAAPATTARRFAARAHARTLLLAVAQEGEAALPTRAASQPRGGRRKKNKARAHLLAKTAGRDLSSGLPCPLMRVSTPPSSPYLPAFDGARARRIPSAPIAPAL